MRKVPVGVLAQFDAEGRLLPVLTTTGTLRTRI